MRKYIDKNTYFRQIAEVSFFLVLNPMEIEHCFRGMLHDECWVKRYK